jgi:hypothetical protein
MEYAKNVVKGSLPYLSNFSAVLKGDFSKLNPLGLLFALKKQYRQYHELLKDVESAYVYFLDITEYVNGRTAQGERICNYPEFKACYDEFNLFLQTLMDNSEVRKQMEAKLNRLTAVVEHFDETKNVQSYMSNLRKIGNDASVVAYPQEKRFELLAVLQRMHNVMENLIFHPPGKTCTLRRPLALTSKLVQAPISIAQIKQDEAIFQEKLQQEEEEFYQTSSGQEQEEKFYQAQDSAGQEAQPGQRQRQRQRGQKGQPPVINHQ